jgi:hypothetical protein
MTDQWQKAFEKLNEFINRHDEINFGVDRTTIPESVRSEFYTLFDATREAFIKDHSRFNVRRSIELSKNYHKAVKEVKELLHLTSISAPDNLNAFLSEPLKALSRPLFDILFKLIKGIIDIEQFGNESTIQLKNYFNSLYREGYEKWIILSLIKLLDANGLYEINVSELPKGGAMMAVDLSTEAIPPITESKRLVFKDSQPTTLSVVDCIIRSSISEDIYIGFRSATSRAMSYSVDCPINRTRLPVNSALQLLQGFVLVYTDTQPERIRLVNDMKYFYVPDLLICFKEQQDWCNPEEMGRIQYVSKVINPTLGIFIVSQNPLQTHIEGVGYNNITFLHTDFDCSKLEPIAKTIAHMKENITDLVLNNNQL